MSDRPLFPLDPSRYPRIGALTGAGASAESGVPTFRGKDGYWRNHPPERLASAAGFRADPVLVWEWYLERRDRVRACEPNAGHRALAALDAAHPDFLLATQNVDDLHDRAGAKRKVALHGSLFATRCVDCGRDASGEPVDRAALPPRCPCGGLRRPGVVWFGESLDPFDLERAFEHAAGCDLYLVVGTSGLVQPAASLPLAAKEGGALLVEVNPEPTPLTPRCDASLRLPASGLASLLAPPS